MLPLAGYEPEGRWGNPRSVAARAACLRIHDWAGPKLEGDAVCLGAWADVVHRAAAPTEARLRETAALGKGSLTRSASVSNSMPATQTRCVASLTWSPGSREALGERGIKLFSCQSAQDCGDAFARGVQAVLITGDWPHAQLVRLLSGALKDSERSELPLIWLGRQQDRQRRPARTPAGHGGSLGAGTWQAGNVHLGCRPRKCRASSRRFRNECAYHAL